MRLLVNFEMFYLLGHSFMCRYSYVSTCLCTFMFVTENHNTIRSKLFATGNRDD